VRRLLLGLHGECGDGTEDITTRFRHLPVRAGRFSLARRWTDTFSGGSMRARSRGSAVVHAAAISGRYGEADRYLSRHGRTTDRCRARTFRWAAASSAPGDTRGGV
jgi:hypothetical protein